MLDIQLIRAEVENVVGALKKRGFVFDGAGVLSLDQAIREGITTTEAKRNELKTTSKQIPIMKKNGEDVAALMEQMKSLREEISADEDKTDAIKTQLEEILLQVPNIPHPQVPVGSDESDNVEIRKWGTIPKLTFQPKAHDDLGRDLGIMDFELGVQLAKARFTVLRGAAAKMERALINFMLDQHSAKGYEEILPPFLANSATLTGTGQLPKFGEDLFRIQGEDLYLIPTAEVPLTNMLAQKVSREVQKGKPVYLTAYTPCFRSEAGSHGKDVRGYIRQHQFNKVELVKICHPEDSDAELEKLTADAESILQALELPYRVMALCTGDIGFSSCRTYDLEVWLPSQDCYREISSCSTFSDFQARRAGIRFKDALTQKNTIAHTINGSGLAVGRTLVAIMENYQTAEGKIVVPHVLRPYMGGLEIIG